VKSRFIVVKFPVFSDFVIHVETTKNFDKTIKKYPDILDAAGDNEDADALTVYDGNFTAFIFLKPNASIEALADESWHAIRRMMIKMRVELDNEAVAYHLGYLVDKVFKFVRGRK